MSRRPRGLRLALSWLTVFPVGTPADVDFGAARRALYWAPVVGAALGVLAAGLLAALHSLGAPPLLAGLVVVASLAGCTRAMHLDGLADTADGLGCYGGTQRALEVMREGSCGPFAVVALVLVLATQAAALGTLAQAGRLIPVVLALIAGRAAFGWCARRGVPAARPAGLGALVAGSQPLAVPVAWFAILLAGGLLAVPGRAWQGTLAVAVAALVVVTLSAHTRRRLGGVTGDVLGATSELTTTIILTICALA
ncbi:MAG TPA: adenosylcobinamide-GDP ribazoletransferase [Pseudonocardiaceae bacterium]|nr:adenosylcobinamide-GDP ribazoletransferase [Pseudonocardiaceae bacterium]